MVMDLFSAQLSPETRNGANDPIKQWDESMQLCATEDIAQESGLCRDADEGWELPAYTGRRVFSSATSVCPKVINLLGRPLEELDFCNDAEHEDLSHCS